MIEARPAQISRAFVDRLARKAAQLAQASAQNRLLARKRNPRRWRSARLLWPLFTKD